MKTISIRLEDAIYEELGGNAERDGGRRNRLFMKRLQELRCGREAFPLLFPCLQKKKKMKAGKRWRLLPDWRLQGRRLAGRWITIKSGRKQ